MVRIITVIFSLVFLLPSSSLLAQNLSITKMKNRPVKRKRKPAITEEMSAGLRLNSDGWSFMMERGFIKRYDKKTNFIWADLSEKYHPKEYRLLNETFAAIFPQQAPPLSYKYGKINNFYQFKFGVGQKRQLSGKLDKKNVVIHWTYAAGVSIGFLKPYYLEILFPEGNNTFSRQTVKYDDPEKQFYFLDEFSIIGGTSFTQGLGELQVRPGLSARSGFYFDFSPAKKSFYGVEIGSSIELYPQRIELMANTTNTAAFINLYVDVRFGKRWSR